MALNQEVLASFANLPEIRAGDTCYTWGPFASRELATTEKTVIT
jgi:hypothetical protein